MMRWLATALIVALASPPAPTSEPPASASEPAPASEPPAPVLVPPAPEPMQVDPRNYRMVLAGDIIVGLSGIGMITLAIGLGTRSDAKTQRQALTVADVVDADAIAKQEQRMQTGGILAITGGIATLVLLSSGVTLIALGHRRERLRRMSLQAQLTRRYTGLTWTLRF